MNQWYELTPEEEQRRDAFIFDMAVEKTKKKGDYWFNEAERISGDGDYIRGVDDGEPPKNAIW